MPIAELAAMLAWKPALPAVLADALKERLADKIDTAARAANRLVMEDEGPKP